MGNSGNASPEFTINPSSTFATTGDSSSSSDKVIAQKDSNGLDPVDPSHLPPDFLKTSVSPVSPVTPKPQFSDPEIDSIETKPLSEGAPAPHFCRERHPSPHTESTPHRAHNHNLASDEGSNKHC